MTNGNGKPGVWLSLILSIVLPAVSGAVGATVWAFSMRDQVITAEAERRREALTHYVSVEQFLGRGPPSLPTPTRSSWGRRQEERRRARHHYHYHHQALQRHL
jgi:hypothetical protein